MVEKFDAQVKNVLRHLERFPHGVEAGQLQALFDLESGYFKYCKQSSFLSYDAGENVYKIQGKGLEKLRDIVRDELAEKQTEYNRKLTTFNFFVASGTITLAIIALFDFSTKMIKQPNHGPTIYILFVGAIFSLVALIMFSLVRFQKLFK